MGSDEADKAKRLRCFASSFSKKWKAELDRSLSSLLKKVLATETAIQSALTDPGEHPDASDVLLFGT